jgi:hypothetical protein
MRTKSGVFGVAMLCAHTALGAGRPHNESAAGGPDQYEVETRPPTFLPILSASPGPAVALAGYAGIALLVGAGDTRARSVVGGIASVRFRYFQAGGSLELSDSGRADALNEALEESWRTYQAFVGAWLPYERWIDVDAAVGFASRNYSNPDPIYGSNGFDFSGPALTWWFGISDRSGEGRFGARLGAALLGTVDLRPRSLPFERRYLTADGGIEVTRGTTDVGGVSFALVVTGGFELGGGRTETQQASAVQAPLSPSR